MKFGLKKKKKTFIYNLFTDQINFLICSSLLRENH